MKTARENFAVSALSLAVHGALAAMFALPLAALAQGADDEIAALTRPTNTVEIGVSNTSLDSAKFGEYNGLNKSGANLIGNFSIRGGDAYGGDPGATRWSLSGSDLGTTSRTLGADYGKQGQWKLSVGHDELRHNLSDTYQTYLQGSLGGNAFTAPPTFGVFNGNSAVLAASSRNLDATQRSLYHDEDVSTTRKNTSFAIGFNFSPQLSVQFDFDRLKQTGAKLSSSGALGGVLSPYGGANWRAEAIGIYMNPTNYTTDNFNLALNWVGDKGHLTGSYHGSVFRDGYDRVTWQNVQSQAAGGVCASGGACVYQTNTMSTAPDNRFHQLNLSGGYAISSATKLAGGLSYGRNTQNSSFLTGMPETVLSPQSSLNGLVVTKHADLKLTHQATRDLSFNAGVKINERDNRSTSSTYQYFALNDTALADVSTNAPYSNKKTELELAGDYRFNKRHSVRLAYNHEKISRWCNSMANGFNNCVVSPSSKEDKLGIKYKLKATSDVALNAGYTYAKRRSQFDHDAVTPLSGLSAGVVASPNDVNAQDYPGFIAHIYASRKQQMLKAGVNWQVTEQLDLGVNGRYASDKYFESTLGVQDGRTKGLNLDATYTYSEENSVAAYVSWQNSKRNLRSGGAGGDNTATSAALLVAPTSIWTNQLTDDSTAFGINTKHSGLMGGKLELKGDLSYSLDKTGYATQLEYAAPATCAATILTACGPLPDISSKVFTLKLTGTYQVDKTAKVALGYIFQQRRTDDYYYNTLQFGNTPSRNMPTNEQAPNSSVNMIAASYIYSFK